MWSLLHISKCPSKQLNIWFKFSIIGLDGKQYYTKESQGIYDKECLFDMPVYVRKDYLYKRRNNLLPNDRLTIFCEAIVSTGFFPQDKLKNPTEINATKIENDLSALLISGKHHDVTFCIGDKEFKVHRNILTARSSVFASMFEHDFGEETRFNRVNVFDVDVQVFEQMLIFIYTGKVDLLELHADKLLIMAYKYDLSDLKSLCETYLATNITVDSACSLLVLADVHNCVHLKNSVLQFFHSFSSEIQSTKDCLKLMASRPDLFKELYFSLAKKFLDLKSNP